MILCLAAAPSTTRDSSDHWWNQQWPYRVLIDCPKGEGDVADVSVSLAGRTTENGADLRVVDDEGVQQPFEIVHHDPLLRTNLAIRVPDNQPVKLWLYYGNLRASPINTLRPDARQPEWQPKSGIVLRVYRKARAQYPKKLPELLQMIVQAKQEGGDFVSNISHGHNPFGLSDQYISVYDGYLRIDPAGKYGFCTASADGSWVNVNDKTIVEWPGPHGWGGSEQGQINGVVDFPAKTIAHIRYYQEAGAGPQMAFMGWKPPGSEHFTAIPQDQWTKPRRATARDYESSKQSILAVPEADVLSTFWLPDTLGKQVAMVRVGAQQSRTRAGARIVKTDWDFGDGLSGSGLSSRHVYFRMGRPIIRLSVTDDAGNTDSCACSPDIFLVDIQAGDVHFGNADDYFRESRAYDTAKLERDDLSLFAEFLYRMEKWKPFADAAKVYLARFPAASDAGVVATRAADACADPTGAFDPAISEQMFVVAIDKSKDDVETNRQVKLRRAHNLAWNLGKLDPARAIYQDVIDTSKRGPLDQPTRRAAVIGLGDVALLRGDLAEAKLKYTEAEKLADKKPPPEQAIELAKLGSYPWAVDDYLARGAYDEAIDTLDQWESLFPLQKLEGTSLLLRGKVLFVKQPSEAALKYLELSEAVNPSSTQVAEAVWLRASCLLSIGKTNEAATQFRRIMTDFTKSEYAAKAKDKLGECEKKMAKP